MAQFATASDLANRLGVSLSDSEQTRAKSLLELASGLVQQEARQTIERVKDDTLTRRGTGEARIRLPQRPVESVSSVTLAGEEVEAEAWYVEDDELVRDCGGWGHPDETLVVVYTHGYAEIPELARAIALEAVVRVWVNPGAVMQEGYGSERTSYLAQGVPRGLLLSDAEKSDLRDAFRRGAGTLGLR